jgi:hypothetical protein
MVGGEGACLVKPVRRYATANSIAKKLEEGKEL